MSRPPLPVLLALLLVLGGATVFLMTRTATSPATRACEQRYAEARTAQDSIAVDTLITPEAKQLAQPRTCVSFRSSARWQ